MHKSIVLLLAALATPVFADSQPTTMPSTSPTSAPTTMEEKKPIELGGYLAPIDAQEVKPKLKRFAAALTVTDVVAYGAPVKAGQKLITFDLTDLDQEILEATSDLDVAKAAESKAQSDAALGERSDAASLEEKTDSVSDAEAGVAWWRDIEGPDFLKRLDLGVKASQDGIDDQNDELDQLRKMYKSEELTNATADIVVKRAVRGLQRAKDAFVITEHASDRQKATEYPNQKQAADRALVAAKIALDDANATIAQSKVTRAASLLKSHDAVHDAQKKLNELEQDKQTLDDIKAKADGIAYYGGFKDGAWQGSTEDAIKVGEKSEAEKPLLTVIQPGKLRVIVKVDEANLFAVHEGGAVTVTPAAMPDAKVAGKLSTREPLGGADGSFDQKVELSSVDPRLVPGMKVKIELAAEGK